METKQLTRQEVEANPYMTQAVREQAAWIRCELELDGVVRWSGRGYDRIRTDIRSFAFRVLVAKGEIVRCDDPRFYVAA